MYKQNDSGEHCGPWMLLFIFVPFLIQNIGYTQSSQPVPSVFSYASDVEGLWNKYLLNHGGNFSSPIQGAASSQNGEGQALFALSSNEGSILLIKMPPLNMQGMERTCLSGCL